MHLGMEEDPKMFGAFVFSVFFGFVFVVFFVLFSFFFNSSLVFDQIFGELDFCRSGLDIIYRLN